MIWKKGSNVRYEQSCEFLSRHLEHQVSWPLDWIGPLMVANRRGYQRAAGAEASLQHNQEKKKRPEKDQRIFFFFLSDGKWI